MARTDGGDESEGTRQRNRTVAVALLAVVLVVVAAVVWVAATADPAETVDWRTEPPAVTGQPAPDPPGPVTNSTEDPIMLDAEPDAAGIAWRSMVEVARGEGYQGPWRMNESDWRYVDAPTVALEPGGGTALAWVDMDRKNVFFQRFGVEGEPVLEAPTDVSRSPDIFSWLPRVAVDADDPDRIHVLWQEIVFSGGSHGGEIFFARSTDGGETFSEPLNLSQTPAGAGKGRLTSRYWHNGSLDLAPGPEGEVLVAWTEYEGLLRFARSTDGGESFSEPLTVAGEGEDRPARGPDLAVAPDGAIHLAWTVGEDPQADIHLATSRDGGETFGRPRAVHGGEGHADAPKIAAAEDGTLHLAYAEAAEGAFQRYRVLYARSTDGGESFETPRAVAGPDDGGVETAHFPNLAVDGRNRVFLLWHLHPDPGERPRGLALAVSRDGGEGFSEPAVVPGTADAELGITGSLQGLLVSKLAVDDAGTVAVVNGTFRQNRESRVRLIRGELGE